MSSTSSVYGSNTDLPYKEIDISNKQISFYAVTKKSNESMTHYYSYDNLPVTIFRFFTVYGPWGRPDMALFKFTKGILENKSIKVFNFGKMERDFTFVDDIVHSIYLLIEKPPNLKNEIKFQNDSLSNCAPWRVVNIGNNKPIKLLDYIKAIEKELGIKAKQNLKPMQIGDIPSTFSNNDLLSEITGFKPKTDIKVGVKKFINWYKSYYE